MREPTDLEKAQAALAREQMALKTARDEAAHWKTVAVKLDEQLKDARKQKP